MRFFGSRAKPLVYQYFVYIFVKNIYVGHAILAPSKQDLLGNLILIL